MNIWIAVAWIAGGIGFLGFLSYLFKWGIGAALLDILVDVADIASNIFSAIGDIDLGD